MTKRALVIEGLKSILGFGSAVAFNWSAVGQPIGGRPGGQSEERPLGPVWVLPHLLLNACNRRMATGQNPTNERAGASFENYWPVQLDPPMRGRDDLPQP